MSGGVVVSAEREGWIYRLYDAAGALLYIGATKREPKFRGWEHSSKQPWAAEIAELRAQPISSGLRDAEALAIRYERPKYNSIIPPEVPQTSPESQRSYRDRKRGAPPRQLQPHGTNAAIRRHERAGEPLCALCSAERNRLAREYYQQRSKP